MPQVWQEEKEAFDIHTWKKSQLYSSLDTPEKYDEVVKSFDKLLESHGVKKENIIYKGENSNDVIAIFCHVGFGMVFAHIFGYGVCNRRKGKG